MYRIILILSLLVVLYFLLRSAIRELKARGAGDRVPLDKNQMVQDPVCRVFVPRGSATAEDIGGQTYYFCSRACAKVFQRQLAGQQPE
ncbi:MAG TPA: YHS domain-containing protein [Nitrospiraceae bacterium]|nr:YHS domain-containing protein [Nitrospiraceae bacterium]